MNKNNLILILLFIAFAIKAQSPISISNSNMPSSGDTLRYSNAQISSIGNYTQTGTNFSWNFSTLNPTSQGIRAYKLALQIPQYAFFFLGLNEYGEKIADTLGAGPLTITQYYNFYKKQTSPAAYVADGAGMTFSSIPVPNYYSDKDELYKFQMSYPQYDSTTFKFSTISSTLIPIVYSKTGSRVTKVDGWGNITTPYGTANCLRLITTQYSQDSIKNNIIPFPVGFPNNQRSYQWITTGSKIPYLEINGSLVGNIFTVTQVRYRDIARTIVGVKEQEDISGMNMYPNPVSDKLYFSLKEGEKCSFEIMNINGKLVKSISFEPVNTDLQSINVSSLDKGLYIIKVNQVTNSHYFKFIKE
jgi:hypothetical protein